MDHADPDTCIAPSRALPWPDNRPAARVANITLESLGLTFGEPPVLGGPYARFEWRCLSEYERLITLCDYL